MKKFCVGILWVPFDYGVKLSNGRPGARFGPKKIKQELSKVIKNQIFTGVSVIDFGAVLPVKKDVRRTHERVTLAVKKILKANIIPIVVGGGHDISFGSGKAMFQLYRKSVK